MEKFKNPKNVCIIEKFHKNLFFPKGNIKLAANMEMAAV